MKSCRLAEEAPGEAASGGGSQPTDLAARYVLRTLFFQAMQRVSFALGKWGAEEVWIDLHTCHLNLEQSSQLPTAPRSSSQIGRCVEDRNCPHVIWVLGCRTTDYLRLTALVVRLFQFA